MKLKVATTSSLAVFAISACAIQAEPSASDAAPDLNACLTQVMSLMEGKFDYTGVNARISGGYSTFITQSTHEARPDGSWAYTSFGGDMEAPSASIVRLVGNQIRTRADEDGASEAARTFSACDGPNEVGRITTRSTYELPPIESDPQTLSVDITALYGVEGAYFTETITNEQGEIVAYRSGVSVPTE